MAWTQSGAPQCLRRRRLPAPYFSIGVSHGNDCEYLTGSRSNLAVCLSILQSGQGFARPASRLGRTLGLLRPIPAKRVRVAVCELTRQMLNGQGPKVGRPTPKREV